MPKIIPDFWFRNPPIQLQRGEWRNGSLELFGVGVIPPSVSQKLLDFERRSKKPLSRRYVNSVLSRYVRSLLPGYGKYRVMATEPATSIEIDVEGQLSNISLSPSSAGLFTLTLARKMSRDDFLFFWRQLRQKHLVQSTFKTARFKSDELIRLARILVWRNDLKDFVGIARTEPPSVLDVLFGRRRSSLRASHTVLVHDRLEEHLRDSHAGAFPRILAGLKNAPVAGFVVRPLPSVRRRRGWS